MTDSQLAALSAIRDAFAEVALRANRLREWTDMEPHLRNIETSFEAFYDELQSTSAMDFGTKADKLRALWSRCQDTDIVDFQSFVNGIRYINQPASPAGDGAGIDATVLVDQGKLIEQDLNTGVGPDQLKAHSAAFLRTLRGELADRRITAKHEVQELCELTIQLKMRLNA